MTTNRDNSFRLAESPETIQDCILLTGIDYATLSAGAITASHLVYQPPLNAVSFNAGDGNPIMEFRTNGDIYIRGNLVVNDMEVVEGMRDIIQNRW